MEDGYVSKLFEIIEDIKLHLLPYERLIDIPLEPVVVKQHLCVVSVFFFLDKCLCDEVFGRRRDHLPNLVIEFEVTVDDGMKDVCLAFPFERGSPRQEDVGNDSDTPRVNLLIIRLLLDDFRSHVQRATQYFLDSFFRVVEACKSKISDLYVQVLIIINVLKENVLRLYVSIMTLEWKFTYE